MKSTKVHPLLKSAKKNAFLRFISFIPTHYDTITITIRLSYISPKPHDVHAILYLGSFFRHDGQLHAQYF